MVVFLFCDAQVYCSKNTRGQSPCVLKNARKWEKKMLEIIVVVGGIAFLYFINEVYRGYKGRSSVISVVICGLLLSVPGAFLTICGLGDLIERDSKGLFVVYFIMGLPCLLIGLGLFIKNFKNGKFGFNIFHKNIDGRKMTKTELTPAFTDESLKKIQDAIDHPKRNNPQFHMELTPSCFNASFGDGEGIEICLCDKTYRGIIKRDHSEGHIEYENEQSAVDHFIKMCAYAKTMK